MKEDCLTLAPFNRIAPASSTMMPLHKRRMTHATSIERGDSVSATAQIDGMLRSKVSQPTFADTKGGNKILTYRRRFRSMHFLQHLSLEIRQEAPSRSWGRPARRLRRAALAARRCTKWLPIRQTQSHRPLRSHQLGRLREILYA
jgi:hypothetical protein